MITVILIVEEIRDMRKKGFTIVELLAVITILGLLLTLAVPMILSASGDVQKGLSKQMERGLKESGELLGLDLDDYSSAIYNCKESSWISTKCTKPTGIWTEATVSIQDLIDHGYFKDTNKYCSGDLTVTKSGNGYAVTLNTVTCN